MYAGVGSEAYPPALMLKIVLYEFSEGRCSPSQWHRDARDHIPLRWLGEGIAPSRTACYNFRDRIGDVLPLLHAQVVRQARDEGLVTAKQGVLDGTAIRAAEILGQPLQAAIADAGYASLLDIEACLTRGVELFAPLGENDFTERNRAGRSRDAVTKEQFEWLAEEQTYRCPRGHRLLYKGRQRKPRREEQMVWEHRFHCPAEHCRACPLAARCVRNPDAGRTIKRLEGQELLDAHRARMTTSEARAARRLRSSVIERCFADQKHHRQFRRFHGRGLRRARAEYGLFILTHNAITLARRKNQTPTPTQTAA